MSHVWFAMQNDGAGEATQDSGKRKRPYLVMVRDQLEALNSAQLTAERRRTIYVGEVAPRVEFEESGSKRNRRQRGPKNDGSPEEIRGTVREDVDCCSVSTTL